MITNDQGPVFMITHAELACEKEDQRYASDPSQKKFGNPLAESI